MEKFEFYKGRVIDENTKVFVYYNLHKKMFSVKALSGEHKGKVVLHTTSLLITEAHFIVNQSGRIRVLREKCKNVHAGVAGYLDFTQSVNPAFCIEQITYNPYKYESFVSMKDYSPITFSPFAYLSQKKVWITDNQAS